MIADQPRPMVVAGVMSGTSADGVDVALLRVSPGAEGPTIEVIGHRGFEYSQPVRAAVLAAMDADNTSVAALSRLNWRLGEVYATCIAAACADLGTAAELVGMHGQTVYHQATAQHYADAPVRATWQMGEAAVVRERLGIPVVSDFRPADLAAGGQGAPLVPMLDWCMYRSATEGRVLLNLGGIANISVMPAGCRLQDVVAFDTGPANMVIDELMRERFGREFDEGGQVAIRGKLLPDVLDNLLQEQWFKLGPPKSCGREQFGATYIAGVMRLCADADGADVVRTAAELTVRSVVDAVRRHGAGATEILVAGGGVKNAYIMGRLADELPGVQVAEGAQAKEAVAFGLLAWLTWFGLDGNVASATGARGGRVLGKISW